MPSRRNTLLWNLRRVAIATGVVASTLTVVAVALGAPPMMTVHTGAKLRILNPTPNNVVTANSVPTDVSISNFKLNCDYAGTANRKGIGHYHVELDHSLINMFCSPKGHVSMLDVAPGKHTLSFIPAADDHADDMGATKKVSFVYKPSHALPAAKPLHFAGKPTVEIVSPKNGATVHGGFDFVVAAKNFKLSCDLYGKANVAGYGHWHANVDSSTKGMMGMATMLGMSCGKSFHVSLAGVKPGTHRFIAILEDNTHAPTIGVQASVNVTVK